MPNAGGKRKKVRWFKKTIGISFFFFIIMISSYYGSLFIQEKRVKILSPTVLEKKAKVSPTKDRILVDIKTLLDKEGISFFEVKQSSDSSYLITLSSGEEVVISHQKSLESQIDSLQLILSRLTIEGKRFTQLDFRFDKPVITFN